MRRLIAAALAGLFLSSCTTMEFLDTLNVVSDAYAIKQCRKQYDPDEQPWAYAGCENGW